MLVECPVGVHRGTVVAMDGIDARDTVQGEENGQKCAESGSEGTECGQGGGRQTAQDVQSDSCQKTKLWVHREQEAFLEKIEKRL